MEHPENSEEYKGLTVNKGIEQPSIVNPYLKLRKKTRRREFSVGEYVEGIVKGDVTVLSQAVTLVESVKPEHQAIAQEVIEKCLPYSGNSMRIGISGVPGAGKSTSIDVFGLHVLEKGGKLAVLAIDPSSERSKGSILGDKTRMEKLSVHPKSFIRPSPSAGSLGGVARKTRETIILCEAAGFDAVPLDQFQTGRYDIFLGSMYGFTEGYPQSEVLKQNPDYLEYYLPIADTHARYYADGNLESGTPVSVVYTELDDSVSNKYLCFIGGDTPVCIVESDVQGPTCIVLKESYGNAFVPFLTSHYGRIIVIDPREFNRDGKPTLNLTEFAADQGVDDLIVINYPYMINSKAFIRYLNALAGVQ